MIEDNGARIPCPQCNQPMESKQMHIFGVAMLISYCSQCNITTCMSLEDINPMIREIMQKKEEDDD